MANLESSQGSLPFDAIVLAGGRSTRLGRNKLNESLGNRTILERVVMSLELADTVVVVGTEQTADLSQLMITTGRSTEKLIITSEDPPGSGPAMGIAAGIAALGQSEPYKHTVILGGDMPFVSTAIPSLLTALSTHRVAVLVDNDNQMQYLASAWNHESLIRAASNVRQGDSVRSLFSGIEIAQVLDRHQASIDIDTEADLGRAIAKLDAAPPKPPPSS